MHQDWHKMGQSSLKKASLLEFSWRVRVERFESEGHGWPARVISTAVLCISWKHAAVTLSVFVAHVSVNFLWNQNRMCAKAK